MDSVEKLFRGLPAPMTDDALTRRRGITHMGKDALMAHLKAFLSMSSEDPDDAYLMMRAEQCVESGECLFPEFFRQSIMQLSLLKTEIPDDGSAKSQQLRYHRWIGQGRKDSDCPFPLTTPCVQSGAYLPNKPNTKACVTCGKAEVFACSGCLLKLDPQHATFKTWYCSQDCQKADRPQHKEICKSRKMVGRAAILLRDLFVLFQGLNTTYGIISVQEEHGILYQYSATGMGAVCKGTQAVQPFPRELVSSEEDYQACVTNPQSGEVNHRFRPLVDFFLASTTKDTKEVGISPRNVHRPTTFVATPSAGDNMMALHFPLRAQLHTGEVVAIDITCAEYGWREPVSLWEDWETHRVHGQVHALAPNTKHPLKHPKVEQFREKQVAKMYGAVVHTINEQFPGARVLAAKFLSASDYENLRIEVMTAARQALETGLTELAASKTLRWYMDADFERELTHTTEQSVRVLEKVWMTNEEYGQLKHDFKLLQALWTRRCRVKKVAKDARELGLRLPSDSDWDDDGGGSMYRTGGQEPDSEAMQALLEHLRRMRTGNS
ncbi:hypothetical protein PG984_000103 [Apiospora sp. TS-2023a]